MHFSRFGFIWNVVYREESWWRLCLLTIPWSALAALGIFSSRAMNTLISSPTVVVVANQPLTFYFTFPYDSLCVFFFEVSNLPGDTQVKRRLLVLPLTPSWPPVKWVSFVRTRDLKERKRKKVTCGYFQYNFSFSSMPWCSILKNIMFLGWSVFSFNETAGHSCWAQKLNVTSSVPCYLAENSGCMLFM